MKCTAIILAAGQGKRMKTKVQKQFLMLQGKPLLYYSLACFQKSDEIQEIVVVTGKESIDYCRSEIIEKYGFTKVKSIAEGGKERYDSVYAGLEACSADTDYVFIHDGARPFVTENILRRGYDTVCKCRACVAGMPSKDTIKIVDDKTYSTATPERKYVWAVQTPQIFETELITDAYSRLMGKHAVQVTDDAMVLEQMLKMPVKLFEGSYENIKITTPEDLDIAKMFLLERRRQG